MPLRFCRSRRWPVQAHRDDSQSHPYVYLRVKGNFIPFNVIFSNSLLLLYPFLKFIIRLCGEKQHDLVIKVQDQLVQLMAFHQTELIKPPIFPDAELPKQFYAQQGYRFMYLPRAVFLLMKSSSLWLFSFFKKPAQYLTF